MFKWSKISVVSSHCQVLGKRVSLEKRSLSIVTSWSSSILYGSGILDMFSCARGANRLANYDNNNNENCQQYENAADGNCDHHITVFSWTDRKAKERIGKRIFQPRAPTRGSKVATESFYRGNLGKFSQFFFINIEKLILNTHFNVTNCLG